MNCTRPECPGRAVWRPVLDSRASPKSPPVKITFTKLALCEACKDGSKLATLLSPSSWDKIVRHFREAGKPAPKRHLTNLRFEVVDSPESTDEEKLAF